MCRPVRDQRSWYCGHHHTHCFKWYLFYFGEKTIATFFNYLVWSSNCPMEFCCPSDPLMAVNMTGIKQFLSAIVCSFKQKRISYVLWFNKACQNIIILYSSQAEAIQIGELLATHCSFPDRNFVLYADSGFAMGANLITPFRRGRNQSNQEAEWNRQVRNII